MKRYIKNIAIVIFDILPNALIGGSPYMTYSERAWRHQWLKSITVLDFIFGKGHCESAEEGDELQYETFKRMRKWKI
jgi:hypothetical protein